MTDQCHANIKSSRVLHGPVSQNQCDACHQLTSAAEHTFAVTREKTDLCTFCHEFKIDPLPVVHKPVKTGECLGCHDPHGGPTRALGREATTAELCGRCHESVAHGRSFLHTPVMEGDCTACHAPHASRFTNLLDATGTDLCLACHTEFDKQLAGAKFRHKALDDGCEKCHDAHGTNFAMATTQPAAQQCAGCHEPVRLAATSATHAHSVVLSGERACITCHTPHGGQLDQLMADVPGKVCMTCHKDEQRTAAGRTVAAMPELADPTTFKHGPIRDGQCGGCHGAHGTNRPAMLTRTFSTTPYRRFSAQQYDLCFGSCHDEKLVTTEPAGPGVTNFRDGTRNLHLVHANDGDRGRSCNVCHDTHATPGTFNVRATFAYGKQQLPMHFTKTPTGGGCSPGCHVAYGYDRETPVNSAATTRAATRPATAPWRPPAVARAEREPAVVVKLVARDVRRDGSNVRVPAGDRPTVLLFLRADKAHEQSAADERQATRLLRTALADGSDAVRVVVIVGGPDARERAAALAASKDVPAAWHVVADAESIHSADLDVRGWPTVIVTRGDGLQLARLAGGAESLLLKLPPYLDLALGKTDAATVERRIATHEPVRDGPERLAGQRLRAARQLLADGKAEQAYGVVTDALREQPASLPLKLALADALAELGRGKDLLTLLNELPPDALTPDRRDVLTARGLIATDRWWEARQLLTATLERNPDLRDAHRLIGQIHERELDWPRAAKAYRKAME